MADEKEELARTDVERDVGECWPVGLSRVDLGDVAQRYDDRPEVLLRVLVEGEVGIGADGLGRRGHGRCGEGRLLPRLAGRALASTATADVTTYVDVAFRVDTRKTGVHLPGSACIA